MAPDITIKIGDKTHTLKWDLWCIYEYEKLYGKTAFNMDQSTVTQIKRLWIMLKKDDPELTLEQVEKLVNEHPDGIASIATDALVAFTNGTFGYSPKNSKAPTQTEKK